MRQEQDDYLMLPSVTELVTLKLHYDATGRDDKSLYLGPSAITGSIVAIDINTQ
jgi:hypothetical protein